MRIEDYLDIKARHGDSFLTKEVIEEMTQFVHALQKVRSSKEDVERLIRDFMRSKLGSESRYIEGYGEVDIDPRLWNWDLWDSYLHRFYDYFYREYQNKISKTIPDAHAYCAFLQYHNMRRKFPHNDQLPDTDVFDIEEAIKAEEKNKAINERREFSTDEFKDLELKPWLTSDIPFEKYYSFLTMKKIIPAGITLNYFVQSLKYGNVGSIVNDKATAKVWFKAFIYYFRGKYVIDGMGWYESIKESIRSEKIKDPGKYLTGGEFKGLIIQFENL